MHRICVFLLVVISNSDYLHIKGTFFFLTFGMDFVSCVNGPRVSLLGVKVDGM